MLKTGLLAAAVLTVSIAAYAQGVLTGRVSDHTGKPLPAATVTARGMEGRGGAYSALTDSAGMYSMGDLAAGRYVLTASFLGYVRPQPDTVVMRPGGAAMRFNLVLYPAATGLAGVTVTSRKPQVTTEKGKVVYNVQNAANSAGQTALDVLARIPGLSVDAEGNISYGGTTGVNVMVNGSMTRLSGPQLANYLKGISAEDVGRVETITAPDASFDAAGSGGIVHIVTRRKAAKGLAVDVRSALSAGHYVMTNQQAALHYQGGPLTAYASFDYNTPHRFIGREGGNAVPGTGGAQRLHRRTASGYRIQYYTRRAGAEWKVHRRHTIALHYHGYLDDFTCFHDTRLVTAHGDGRPLSASTSRNNIVEPYHYDALNLRYQYHIGSAGKKISLDADHTSYRNYSDALMTMRYIDGEGALMRENRLSSYQPGFVKISSVRADAELPFGGLLVKGGVKYAAARNDNNYHFDSLTNGRMERIAGMSDHFKYEEQIAAAYVSAGRAFGRTQVSAGLRLEHTQANGYTVQARVAGRWTYTQLFPSFSVERPAGKRDAWSVTVSHRINRPAYTDLNPVRWYRDEYFYYAGNPQLLPELAWNIASVYSLRRKYIFTLAYRHSNRYLSERLAFDGQSAAIKSQKGNFGIFRRVEMTAALPVAVMPGWEMQWNSTFSYTTYPVAMTAGDRHVSQWAAAVTLQQDFTLPAGFKAALNGYFTTAELRGIFRTRPVAYVDAGIKRSFLQNRLTIQLSASDLLGTNRLKGQSLTDVTDFWYNDRPDSRRAGVSVTWHIGGRSQQPANRRTEEQERL